MSFLALRMCELGALPLARELLTRCRLMGRRECVATAYTLNLDLRLCPCGYDGAGGGGIAEGHFSKTFPTVHQLLINIVTLVN